MADSCLGCCGGLSLIAVLQMLFVRDFFLETICGRKHGGVLCIPWQKELGSFPLASLSKEFEGGEWDRGVLPIFGESEDPFRLGLQKDFSWLVLAYSVRPEANRTEKKKIFPPF